MQRWKGVVNNRGGFLMPNKNYQKGRRKEYSICDKLRAEGFDIVQRSSGSHSPIDIFAISKRERKILLIQSKRALGERMDFTEEKNKEKIMLDNDWLSGAFNVEFVVM